MFTYIPKILLLLVFILLSLGCKEREQHVALGTLERDRITHTATANEVITQLPVKEGQMVNAGDLIAQLDTTLQTAALAKATAMTAEAYANLDKLRNGAREEDIAAASAKVAEQKATLISHQAQFERQQNLIKNDLTSQAAYDRAKAARDTTRARLNSTKEDLRRLTNGTREEDLRMGQAHYLAAVAAEENEQKKLLDLSIKATRNGLLDALPWNEGERVPQGSVVAVLLAGNAPFARVYIPAPYRIHTKAGDTLTLHVDGLDTPIPGRVRWVATEPAFTPYYALNQEERARLSYLAEVDLPEDYHQLPSGVPVQVHLKK